MPQAWIIGGPQGIGKATLAWRMARFIAAHPDPAAPAVQQAKNLAVDPNHPAARKISALSFGDLALLRRRMERKDQETCDAHRVDDVRHAIHLFEQAAGEGGWRMAIIDSADDLNLNSANALLKLIEEPPPRCLFLLVAHHPGRLLPTITFALPPADAAKPRAAGARRRRRAPRSTPRAQKAPSRRPRRSLRPRGRVRRMRRCACSSADESAVDDLMEQSSGATCRVSNGGSPTASPIPSRGAAAKPNSRPSCAPIFDWLGASLRRESGAWPARPGALCGGLGISGARDARPGNLQSGQEGFRDHRLFPTRGSRTRRPRRARLRIP